MRRMLSDAKVKELENKQDKLIAGNNITISDTNVISATGGGGKPTVSDFTAGPGIVIDEDLTNDTVSIEVDQASIPFKVDLATVAFSGDYDDLTNKPTIPAQLTAGNGITIDNNNISTNISSYGLFINNTNKLMTNIDTTYNAGSNINVITTSDTPEELTYSFSSSLKYLNITLPSTSTYFNTIYNAFKDLTIDDKVYLRQFDLIAVDNDDSSNTYSFTNATCVFNLYTKGTTKDQYQYNNTDSNLINEFYTLEVSNSSITLQCWINNNSELMTFISSCANGATITVSRLTIRVYTKNPIADGWISSNIARTSQIPTVSGTNDGANWNTITIGSDTYGIPGGRTVSLVASDNTGVAAQGTLTIANVDLGGSIFVSVLFIIGAGLVYSITLPYAAIATGVAYQVQTSDGVIRFTYDLGEDELVVYNNMTSTNINVVDIYKY